ncbi:TraR/DksA family transcriptional regulator [Scopulibacillus cellulosilyticus]|uniref:TraR/DksA family transcriptional regulator n=1 Tax=Scopulibacillus cellulosilyticus TaxID=2665665 RepID=A0ABW2Q7B8_9BACL
MSLTKEQMNELRTDLVIRKEQLEADLNKGMDFDNGESEMSSVDNHLADSTGDMVDREKTISEHFLNENELQEINEALERMENGQYGICVDTGEEIPYERLKAVPYAKRTKEAQERFDSQRAGADQTAQASTSRLQKPKGKIEDSRKRTIERIEEEHN